MLYTLIVIIGLNSYVQDYHLTADDCYNQGRAILKQNEDTPLIAIECEPEGESL